jgi:hypothetical protein
VLIRRFSAARLLESVVRRECLAARSPWAM